MSPQSFGQLPIPIQPERRPILCSPYSEPDQHWHYNTEDGLPTTVPGRREASYWYKYASTASRMQLGLFVEEERELLPIVNALRDDVTRWRESRYRGATQTTKELLFHWWREERLRRFFFCQLEAVETVIFLSEMRSHGANLSFTPQANDEMLLALKDIPADSYFPPLQRMCAKMATGSGKTVVMAMLAAWSFCNRSRVPSDTRFPDAVLVVCPNLTIRERLQVLRPENADNYYTAFDIVPISMRPLLLRGKVHVVNWHAFLPESEHSDGGRSYAVVNKGPESPAAFAKRVLGELYERAPILVFNDEAHHAWRPPGPLQPLPEESTPDFQSEYEEATVWVGGLDAINKGAGIQACIDLSATPFYVAGSGHIEGTPLPWIVSDFGLEDAIESGIVKIPRLPVSDTTGKPEPRYYRLWNSITETLTARDRLPGKAKKPKPEVVYREAEDALLTLAGQWVERYGYIQQANDLEDKTPPVLIVVCDNTDIAQIFYERISGERETEVLETVNGKTRSIKRTTFGDGRVFPEYFSNSEFSRPTIRIDSKLLVEAEGRDSETTKQDAANQLRRIVASVGKRGEPGEQVRCVVSVSMLTEGWDANNVTHILGLRAFGSQLLCEQVVGRGLRRMSYVPDPETGLLSEEYVDIYGVPFSLIPFRGRKPIDPQPRDRPSNHVHALPDRSQFEIKFPVVEGYAFALRHNIIKANIKAMEPLDIEPDVIPTALFVTPTIGYSEGASHAGITFEPTMQDRQAYYASTHVQTIEFQITQHIVDALLGIGLFAGDEQSRAAFQLHSRHRLFPQVLRLVHAYIRQKVRRRGSNLCELGQEIYFRRIVERMVAAIRPDDSRGEAPLLPRFNRNRPVGSTADVNFKTVRPCVATTHSHINQVAADTQSWEQIAAFHLESAATRGWVKFYARNAGLGFTIPYDYLGGEHAYEPDFLVRLSNDSTLILEIKGAVTDQDRAKHEAALRWRDAVNNWGEQGRWEFQVCYDPQEVERVLRGFYSPSE